MGSKVKNGELNNINNGVKRGRGRPKKVIDINIDDDNISTASTKSNIAEPVEFVESVEPVIIEPVEFVESVEPVEFVESVIIEPFEPVEPVEFVESVESVVPVEFVEYV